MSKGSSMCNFRILIEQSIEETLQDADLFDKPTLIMRLKRRLLSYVNADMMNRHRMILDIKKIREEDGR
jgi:hypothetical protein